MRNGGTSHLVGHGGGSNFAGNGALLEVAEGDVGPGVAIKVQQDVVEPHNCIVQLRYVVMGLDLILTTNSILERPFRSYLRLIGLISTLSLSSIISQTFTAIALCQKLSNPKRSAARDRLCHGHGL